MDARSDTPPAATQPTSGEDLQHAADSSSPLDSGGAAAEATEPDLRPLDPRVRPRWWVGGLLGALQLLIPLLIVDLVAPHPLGNGRPTLIAAGIALLIVAVVPPIRYRRWRYALREQDLWIRSGLLTVTVSVIPYRRLQFVDTRSSVLDRMFGLAELIVHTAALGTSGRLPGLDAEEAERLREVLSRVAPDDRSG